MSIRLRVTLATVALAALGIGVAEATTFVLLRGYFRDRADADVRQVAETASDAVQRGQDLTLSTFDRTDRPVLVVVRDAQGTVVQRFATAAAADVRLPADLLSQPGRSQELGHRDEPVFQAIAIPAGGGTVVAVISLEDEISTLLKLFRISLVVGIVVLALLAVVAAFVLTRSLRPLRRIAATADAIAGGDLTARMPVAPKRSEVGRVSTAVNGMLAEIETAFERRDATEERLRRFLADASHELRTPLTSIRGYAELFRRGASERPADLARAMAAIEEEASRMSRMVEDLLLLARLDDARPLERLPVALDEIAEAAVAAARVVEPDRLLQFEFAERPLMVEGDEGRLRQVLDNLLANVRAHTPAGAPALVSLRIEGRQTVLTVEDTGPGIAPADRERVFDRFSRPDPSRGRDAGGSGLGLAIVRSIVTAHGGEVGVRGAQPHGCIFEIRLPLPGPTSSRETLS